MNTTINGRIVRVIERLISILSFGPL
jgi:hypothetical protein